MTVVEKQLRSITSTFEMELAISDASRSVGKLKNIKMTERLARLQESEKRTHIDNIAARMR